MRELKRFLSAYPLMRREIALYERELLHAPKLIQNELRRKKELLEQQTALIRSCMEQPKTLLERHVVKLHYLEGKVFTEIADLLFISERHAYRLHKSSLLQIKAFLQGERCHGMSGWSCDMMPIEIQRDKLQQAADEA